MTAVVASNIFDNYEKMLQLCLSIKAKDIRVIFNRSSLLDLEEKLLEKGTYCYWDESENILICDNSEELNYIQTASERLKYRCA